MLENQQTVACGLTTAHTYWPCVPAETCEHSHPFDFPFHSTNPSYTRPACRHAWHLSLASTHTYRRNIFSRLFTVAVRSPSTPSIVRRCDIGP